MIELHPEILQQNVAPEHHHHHHKHARQGGAIIVDSVESCLKEAGEIIQAGLTGNQVVEIGELIMLRRDAEQRRRESLESGLDASGVELGDAGPEKKSKWRIGKGDKDKEKEEEKEKGVDKADKALAEWLQKGNVVYKSVGLGLMDVVVGSELVRLADERGVGTRIENF